MVEEVYDENVDDEPAIWWKRQMFLIIMFLMIVMGSLLVYFNYIAPWLIEHEWHQNLDKWNSQGISRYKMTVEVIEDDFREGFISTYVLTVNDNVVIGVEDYDLAEVDRQARFGRYMISSLFEEAEKCKDFSCEIHYDERYGFPEWIRFGWLAGYSIGVQEFTPLEDGGVP